ncbi:hypothetical protein [Novosphingobium beihaiensis]|uniref:Uncharacterized protein n=1 Tax=Novosphingobium beihaiensis TaxID=2930389 RepID=A0ABT0BVD0_9SPHN|nr:hypothetical protein [Novosphingobium beihaiensis]MCJ2188838.1 hypothetical protein [Novosphingobium beihaiensis]
MTGFDFHDVSDFPLVRLSGRGLPVGHGAQLTSELSALLAQGRPFALIFLDTAENPDHADRKALMQWLKRNKKELAVRCRGIVSVEPKRVIRIAKRAQAAAMMAAFGINMKFAADRPGAEALALGLLAGESPPDADDE